MTLASWVVPKVLVVGAADVRQVVSDAVTGLAGSITFREETSHEGAPPERHDELSDALADTTMTMAVVDLRAAPSDLIERLERERPDVTVVAITPPGLVAEAVRAIKLGAEEALEWPVASSDLRTLAERQGVGDRPQAEQLYVERVANARRQILDRAFRVAKAQLMRAVALDVGRPEAYNLLGVLARVSGRRAAARHWWRMALLVDATYQPAKENLDGSTPVRFGSSALSLG